MKITKRFVAVILAVAFVFSSAISVYANSGNGKYDEYKNFYAISHVSEELLDGYFDTLSPEIDELISLYLKHSLYELTREEAILAMLKNFLEEYSEITPYMGDALLRAFDDFGGYYPNTSVGELFSGDVYVGYGIVIEGQEIINAKMYGARVKHVMRNSPAEMGGIKQGDEFLAIDGVNVEGLGLAAVSDLLSASKTNTKFLLNRGGETIDIEISKALVKYESVFYEIIDEEKKVAILTIDNFIDDSLVLELSAILGVLHDDGYKNLIIDLRNNQGGSLEYLYEVLDCFVPEENIKLGTIEMKDGKKEDVISTDYGFTFDKICVLTNENTASAAEAFALALSELAGGVIIGGTTYGKGIGQAYFELANGDIAGITSLELISPSGLRYHGDGVSPDISIDLKYVEAEVKTEDEEFAQLNFVNCLSIKKDAENDAILGLNQRLAKIGYLKPEDVSSKCTDKTITAVEIFQNYYELSKGIDKIDYKFLDYLSYVVTYSATSVVDGDTQLDCAVKLMLEGRQAAEDFAKTFQAAQ